MDRAGDSGRGSLEADVKASFALIVRTHDEVIAYYLADDIALALAEDGFPPPPRVPSFCAPTVPPPALRRAA